MDPTQDEEFAALGIKNSHQAKQAYWAISCLKRSQRWKLRPVSGGCMVLPFVLNHINPWLLRDEI